MTHPRGPRRYDLPRDPAAVLRELRAMREKVGEFQSQVTIQGPIYKSCESIRAKIDDLAAWLTGNKEYFRAPSSTQTSAQLESWGGGDASVLGHEEWPT
jgi:hypothetical protein